MRPGLAVCRPARRPSNPGRREFLAAGRAALACLVVLSGGRARGETRAESLVELEQRTREYQDALGKLVALEEQAVARAAASVDRHRALQAQGLVARRELDAAERAAAEARERLDGTRRQLADSQQVLVEAQALSRLAALPPMVFPGAERSTPEVAEYRGAGPWSLAQIASLEQFFAARFGRSLPVSALGQTATHDRLGFDHRNAVDVAVHPDSVEGRALLDHLRGRGIPFLAFRGPLAGASTGAHVHVGTASPRTS
jgi:hypothetical protein